VSWSSRLPALAHRDFTLFLLGGIVSRIGTRMRDVALGWQIWELTHSPVALGLLGAFRVAPILFFALVGGVTADALDRRRVMIATQSIMALTSLALGIVSLTGRATPALLYTLVALSATATAFDNPARQSLVTGLVPEEDMPNALSVAVFGGQLSTVLGPVFGGFLLGASSAGVVHLVDAVSFSSVLGALVFVRPRPRASRASPVPLRLSAIEPAFAHLRSTPVLFWLMLVDFLATFFAGSLELLPIFADRIFSVGPEGLGLLVSAPAAAAVLTSLLLAARRPIRRQGWGVLASVAAYGAAIAAFGLSTSFPVALGLLALSGAADTVSTVVRQVARQTLTPDELRGRMTALNMIFFMGGPQLGELEAGIVARFFSARVAVVSGGVACVLVAVLFAAFSPALRRLEPKSSPHPG
jgi:MFS family permease